MKKLILIFVFLALFSCDESIEIKDWNIVTEMIYEDLMANKNIRAVSPKDLN